MPAPFSQLGRRVDDFVYSGAIRLLGGGANAFAHLASRYESLGWLDEAIETFKRAISLRPHQASYRIRIAQINLRQQRQLALARNCSPVEDVPKSPRRRLR